MMTDWRRFNYYTFSQKWTHAGGVPNVRDLNAYRIHRTITGSAASHISTFGIRNQCILRLYYFVHVQCLRVEAPLPWPGMFVVPVNLDRDHHFSAVAHMHMAKSTRCKGSSVKKVNIITRPGDVIAGGMGGMGPCPLPQHQPPGQCYITHIYMTYTLLYLIYTIIILWLIKRKRYTMYISYLYHTYDWYMTTCVICLGYVLDTSSAKFWPLSRYRLGMVYTWYITLRRI
jgi:hypothetical protein